MGNEKKKKEKRLTWTPAPKNYEIMMELKEKLSR